MLVLAICGLVIYDEAVEGWTGSVDPSKVWIQLEGFSY